MEIRTPRLEGRYRSRMDPEPDGIVSDLADFNDFSLAEVVEAVEAGDVDAEETLRRVAPSDGAQLLVAASFNSMI